MQNNQDWSARGWCQYPHSRLAETSNPSSIENNTGTDVDLRFGIWVTFVNVTIGTITCDATLLSPGFHGVSMR